MANLNKHDIEFLIDCLKNGKEIPEIYKYAIFPTKQKEYELVYAGKMRKEDVLADTEEAKPVPLQIEKVFNGKKYPLYFKDWHNLLVFGDNLQILKTFYEDKDPLIKGKVKGKVKLIYIDPPFATERDFQTGKGAKAYLDKAKGADFVEFLRRRLIVARELLADDGSIFVHLDQKKGHYIKVILDEIFGENNYRNQIIWKKNSLGAKGSASSYPKNQDIIYFYSKTDNFFFSKPTYFQKMQICYAKNRKGEIIEKLPTNIKIDSEGNYYFTSPKGDYSDESIKKFDKQGLIEWTKNGSPRIKTILKREGDFLLRERYVEDVWDDIEMIFRSPDISFDYPTQKPEPLIERIIKSTTKESDLVMDFFCGSGTTLAVAEKLGRRWIGCDIGKLAIYTTQKRLLEIDKSKDLEDPKKKYGKSAKSFAVVTSGLYDLGKVFALQKDEYIRFVKDLFEIEETKTQKIGGIEIDGKKREFYAKIFPYWELKNASVDEKYLQELHKNIGNKIDGRFYIIAPANNVNFISDYHEIGGVRYYFLKVPYQIIKELHKVQFKKFRQPQSKSQINDLDEAIGFHFIRQPEVKSEIKKLKDKVILKIKKFESAYSQDETGEKLDNFESLAMLLVDLNYDGEKFMMTNYFFAQDLLNHKANDEEESEEEINKELKKQKEIITEFPKKDCGKEIMAIYVDIYGNEFREVFKVK
jgi:site-specific DNA-methyltransferase (adenine-specific)/adenine-specific DNA-methyltransferase